MSLRDLAGDAKCELFIEISNKQLAKCKTWIEFIQAHVDVRDSLFPGESINDLIYTKQWQEITLILLTAIDKFEAKGKLADELTKLINESTYEYNREINPHE
mgnify:CR=1 FL=1|tara:strand:- start:5092 stop:5397 length:306 start_codon:yes stop_codon:yes gene_type:complete